MESGFVTIFAEKQKCRQNFSVFRFNNPGLHPGLLYVARSGLLEFLRKICV